MNNSQKGTSKAMPLYHKGTMCEAVSLRAASSAIALFLSLGMMSSLAGCEIGGTGGEGGEGGEDGAETEQTTPSQDEGGEGGEGN